MSFLPASRSHPAQRELPEEVPVALVFDGSTAAVMMASPADLADFALGFALTEGFIEAPSEIRDLEEVRHGEGVEVRAWLARDRSEALAERRRTMLGPVGCGLCGVDSLDAAMRAIPRVGAEDVRFSPGMVGRAGDLIRDHQPLHDRSQGVHGAGFLLPGEGIVAAREDVGRHNAVDKLFGGLARAEIDTAQGSLVVTSRVSVELVQKCAVVGCPALFAVSAPTGLAVKTAEQAGITLAAFCRGGDFELFAHGFRIA
ncbi:MAG: formate dehydrogenase accessory sulfurtransferase FdhD [Pseudomonadota bacterium]